MSGLFEQSQTDGTGTNELSWSEREKLRECENAIRTNLGAWRELGDALFTIQTERLYRQSYRSFDSYLKTQWGIVRSYAYKLINASQLANEIETLSPTGDKSIVPNPRVLTALDGLPREDRAAAYVQIVQENDGNIPTAAKVAESITDERIGRLDTDRQSKAPAQPPPTTPGRSPYRKGFHVSAFKYDPGQRRVHFQVFKPANRFRGLEAKTENLQIDLVDLEWELRNMGFVIRAIGEEEALAEQEEDCPETPRSSPQLALDDVPRDISGKPMTPKAVAYWQTKGYYPDYVPPTPEQIAAKAAAAEKAAQEAEEEPMQGSFIADRDMTHLDKFFPIEDTPQ